MQNKEVIKTINNAIKYFSGKGKKYSSSLVGLDTKEMVEALRYASEHLSYRIEPKDFIEVVAAASATEKRIKSWLKLAKKNRKLASLDNIPEKEAVARIKESEKRCELLANSLKPAVRVCKRLEKRNKK